ncbi:MAG: hypothetical protein IKY62_02205 [Clostridia bacterium]|nr:hypothetical protein [Clostridia bacterium]
MKKLLCLVLSFVILFSLCGCNPSKPDNTSSAQNNDQIVIKQPTDNSVNGYRVSDSKNESNLDFTDTQSKAEDTVILYYANTSTKKFHLKSCGSASTISNQNLYICEDRQELIDGGYSPCNRCKP